MVGDTLSLTSIPQALITSCDSFPILAIPLFILAGDLMGAGGVSRRIEGEERQELRETMDRLKLPAGMSIIAPHRWHRPHG